MPVYRTPRFSDIETVERTQVNPCGRGSLCELVHTGAETLMQKYNPRVGKVYGDQCPLRTTPSNAISAKEAASSRASTSLRFGNGPKEATSTAALRSPSACAIDAARSTGTRRRRRSSKRSCGANTKSCCVETPFRPTATLTRSGNDGSSRFPTIFEAGPARAGFAPVNGMTARAELTRGCHTAGTQ
jgi:hypothetical protein